MGDRLAEIEARMAAATPGPWIHRPPPQDGTIHSVVHDDPPRVYQPRICHMVDTGYSEASSWAQRSADADLIAAAPTDLRDLLAVAKAAKGYMTASRQEGPGYAYHLNEAWKALDAALANLEGGA